jgi:hypothetical protein
MSDKFSGVISPAIKIEADGQGYVATFRIDSLEFLKDESKDDEYKFVIVASLFKHTLEDFDPNSISKDLTYLCAELPKESFSKEIRLTCDNNMGAYFEYNSEKVDENDLTRYVPKVLIRGQND